VTPFTPSGDDAGPRRADISYQLTRQSLFIDMSPHLNLPTAQARIADLHRQAAVARLSPRSARHRRSGPSPRLVVARLVRAAR
jgi:hypothetical protein